VYFEPEPRALLDDVLVQEQVVTMKVNRHVVRGLRGIHPGNVIHVRVRQQDRAHGNTRVTHRGKQLVDLVPRINQNTLARPLTGDGKAVLIERRCRPRFENHSGNLALMILCVMDDLLFSVKISTAAKSLGGVDLFFERSPEMVLTRIREKLPSLVIFDLNSARMNPMHAIGVMKADAALQGIKTLGFVSHVDSEAIAAARAAGIDQVLARSAFAAQLDDILTRA